jgi:hypothetical protein
MIMGKLILLPCVVLLTAAAPAISGPPATTKQVAPSDPQQTGNASVGGGPAAQAGPQDKKICKQLPTSGSRLPNRACLTASEWKQVEQDLDH